MASEASSPRMGWVQLQARCAAATSVSGVRVPCCPWKGGGGGPATCLWEGTACVASPDPSAYRPARSRAPTDPRSLHLDPAIQEVLLKTLFSTGSSPRLGGGGAVSGRARVPHCFLSNTSLKVAV